MQITSPKKLYYVTVVFTGGISRIVKVKASSREKAEERARKFHPKAIGIQRGSV